MFMLPGAFVYTWLGHAGRDALAGGDGTLRNITIAVSLLASDGLHATPATQAQNTANQSMLRRR
jgi:hypothetical protein